MLKLKQNLFKITADHKESIEELFKITDNAKDLVNGQDLDLRKFGVLMMILQNDLINKLVYKVNKKQGIPVIILREEIAAILVSLQQESKINIENNIKDFSVLSEETGVMFKNNKFILLPGYK